MIDAHKHPLDNSWEVELLSGEVITVVGIAPGLMRLYECDMHKYRNNIRCLSWHYDEIVDIRPALPVAVAPTVADLCTDADIVRW